jgi:adenylate cyclase
MWLVVIPSNLSGAVAVYLYFGYVDPLGGPIVGRWVDLAVFVAVTAVLVGANWVVGRIWLRPLTAWQRRLDVGARPEDAPALVRRRTLNAALVQASLGLLTWVAAGLIYAMLQALLPGSTWFESARVALGIVFAGGVPTSAITFLLAEFHWRRRIPEYFPDGRLGERGIVRLPIRVRLAATFFLTSLVPLAVLLVLAVGMTVRFADDVPESVRRLWARYVWAQVYIVGMTGFASTVMAFLVARFINRPVQALREAMAAVERGDGHVRVPVRSTDELGELNARFNAMTDELRRAADTRELFGRYVSPEVARRGLERGVELGGEVVVATAMFADLRGFTGRSEQLRPEEVVTLLGRYYETVESICEAEQGIITQFLGDGVVVVFGGPLLPVADHADRAVRAARRVQAALGQRDGPDGQET